MRRRDNINDDVLHSPGLFMYCFLSGFSGQRPETLLQIIIFLQRAAACAVAYSTVRATAVLIRSLIGCSSQCSWCPGAPGPTADRTWWFRSRGDPGGAPFYMFHWALHSMSIGIGYFHLVLTHKHFPGSDLAAVNCFVKMPNFKSTYNYRIVCE